MATNFFKLKILNCFVGEREDKRKKDGLLRRASQRRRGQKEIDLFVATRKDGGRKSENKDLSLRMYS